MTSEQALQYIHSTPNFARSAGLHRIRGLLERLGNPQRQLRFVHLAGTNGKGSTAAMVAQVLQTAGYRTGLYTSPYLQRFHERIRLNGAEIPDHALSAITEQVRQAVECLTAEGVESPNEFELVTAIGLCYYAQQRADIVVLEVGLGGRYDATNVIDAPLACGITSISLDHTAVLGDTVEAIAQEKVGIIKGGSICVLAPGQQEAVRSLVRRTCADCSVPLLESSREGIFVLSADREGLHFLRMGRRYRLPLLGAHQRDNLCTALDLIEALRLQGVEIPESAVEEGLAQVRWPGRMELLHGGTILLDCCHNPDGIAALCRGLDAIFPQVPILTVMGMLRDKDYTTGIGMLARRSRAFFAVSPPSPRALAPEEIAAAAAQNCREVRPCATLQEALAAARQERREGELVVICGSIPLVGAARELLVAS